MFLALVLVAGVLGTVASTGLAGALARPARVSVLALANSASASDIATATALVAAGAADTVVFAETAAALGSGAAWIVHEQQPTQILLVGGVAALATSVEAELRRLSAGVTLARFAGHDRMHSAALAAQHAVGSRTASVVLANGWSLPDVGAAASAAAQGIAGAVLYTGHEGLGEATVEALRALQPDRVLIAGGTAAVPEAVGSAVSAVVPGVVVERLGGATRIETARLFADRALEAGASTVVLADGWAPADVVVAASVAAALDSASVLYTRGDELGDVTELALFEHRPKRIIVVSTAAPVGHESRSWLRRLAPGASVIVVGSPHEATHLTLGTSPPPPDGEFTTVSVGPAVACAVAADSREIECWGDDEYELTSTPLGGFADVSVGVTHACAVRTSGGVACWGAVQPALDAGQADPPKGAFTAVASGLFHSCALRTDATLACWGANGIGPLDVGQADPPTGRYVAVSTGSTHSCAIASDGAVVCWGSNDRGQSTPPSGSFAAISAGAFHTCAIRVVGSLACWGANRSDVDFGQAAAPQGLRFLAVAAGTRHTCAVERSGAAVCWGDDTSRQSTPPVGIFTAVAAGTHQTCAIGAGRTLACWGAFQPLNPDDGTSDQHRPSTGEADDAG